MNRASRRASSRRPAGNSRNAVRRDAEITIEKHCRKRRGEKNRTRLATRERAVHAGARPIRSASRRYAQAMTNRRPRERQGGLARERITRADRCASVAFRASARAHAGAIGARCAARLRTRRQHLAFYRNFRRFAEASRAEASPLFPRRFVPIAAVGDLCRDYVYKATRSRTSALFRPASCEWPTPATFRPPTRWNVATERRCSKAARPGEPPTTTSRSASARDELAPLDSNIEPDIGRNSKG